MTDAGRPGNQGQRLPHLDMMRGLAALLVMFGHARGFLFLDASQQSDLSWPAMAFYLLTSFGHQAVIVFFALSGFLVGGQAFRQILDGRWNIGGYWVRRLSRLWTVLVPALLVTLLCDTLGRSWGHAGFYSGEAHSILSSGPYPGAPVDLGASAFIGNLLFLQTIAVPVFGSNGSLWSLANEFFYYLLFPLALLAWFLPARKGVPLGAAVAIAMLLLPGELVILGLIWVAGAIAALCLPRLAQMDIKRRWAFGMAAAAVTLAGLATSRFGPPLPGDLLLGLGISLLLVPMAQLGSPSRLYRRTAFGLSEISYSLYACHFPIVGLIWLTVLDGRQTPFSGAALLVWMALVASVLGIATLFWYLTERNTARVQAMMDRTLRMVSRPVGTART